MSWIAVVFTYLFAFLKESMAFVSVVLLFLIWKELRKITANGKN